MIVNACSLSASSVKLNTQLKGSEVVEITPSVGAYPVVGLENTYDWITFEDGKLRVSLTDILKAGRYPLNIQIEDITGQKVFVPTTLTVQTYSKTPGISLSVKGKLDTLNPASAMIYTPRLSNCIGAIERVTLAGPDGDKFKAALDNGSVAVTLKEGQTYATNVTYQVQFQITICGREFLPTAGIRVTQSKPKLTVNAAALTLFQSQQTPLVGELNLSVGEIEKIEVNGKTSSDLLKALGALETDGGSFSLPIVNSRMLKAGKSYTLLLDVIPKNNASTDPCRRPCG